MSRVLRLRPLLMRVSVNWATGAILFEPFTVIPLGAAVARGPLDISPWIVSVSLPLGAMIYLSRLWFAAPADEEGLDEP